MMQSQVQSFSQERDGGIIWQGKITKLRDYDQHVVQRVLTTKISVTSTTIVCLQNGSIVGSPPPNKDCVMIVLAWEYGGSYLRMASLLNWNLLSTPPALDALFACELPRCYCPKYRCENTGL